jgi:hypothetical protein
MTKATPNKALENFVTTIRFEYEWKAGWRENDRVIEGGREYAFEECQCRKWMNDAEA